MSSLPGTEADEEDGEVTPLLSVFRAGEGVPLWEAPVESALPSCLALGPPFFCSSVYRSTSSSASNRG